MFVSEENNKGKMFIKFSKLLFYSFLTLACTNKKQYSENNYLRCLCKANSYNGYDRNHIDYDVKGLVCQRYLGDTILNGERSIVTFNVVDLISKQRKKTGSLRIYSSANSSVLNLSNTNLSKELASQKYVFRCWNLQNNELITDSIFVPKSKKILINLYLGSSRVF